MAEWKLVPAELVAEIHNLMGDCHHDHHGYCQAHNLQPKGQCWVERLAAAPTAEQAAPQAEDALIALGADSYSALTGLPVHTAERRDECGEPFGVKEAIAAIREEQAKGRAAWAELQQLKAEQAAPQEQEREVDLRYILNHYLTGDIRKAALRAFDQMTAAPAAPAEWVGCGECDVLFHCHNGGAKCLRLHEPIAAPAYKLVPVEPTEEMVIAGCRHENMGDMAGRYKAMLAAAPTEQAAPQTPVGWINKADLERLRAGAIPYPMIAPDQHFEGDVPLYARPFDTERAMELADEYVMQHKRWMSNTETTPWGYVESARAALLDYLEGR